VTRPEFNPAKCLRSRNAATVAKLTAKLGTVTVQELLELNARHFAMHPDDAVIAKLWAFNLEFTRRGIGPRWRGIEKFNPSAVPHDRPANLPDRIPSLHNPAMQRKLLLRWADLQWLHHELGPSHNAKNIAWLLLFVGYIDENRREGLFARVAESDDKPHRIVFGLSVPGPYMLALKGFAVSKAGDRCKAVRRRLKDLIQPRLEAFATRPTYTPTADAIAKRLTYAEAVELARGSPTDAARFVTWISGEKVTPQATERMRDRIATDLKLKGRAWEKTVKKRAVPLCVK
jgi:hypothetical protein